jgi:hypothetical protein
MLFHPWVITVQIDVAAPLALSIPMIRPRLQRSQSYTCLLDRRSGFGFVARPVESVQFVPTLKAWSEWFRSSARRYCSSQR